MKKKKIREILRKSIHISSIIIPFIYLYVIGDNKWQMFFLLLGALILSLIIELSRISFHGFRKLFYNLFGLILRRHERMNYTGATFMIFAGVLCVAFYPPAIAFLAMAYLSLGDTFAAMVGILIGKRKYLFNNKSLEGSLACFVTTLVFGLLINPELSRVFNTELNPWVIFSGAIAATLAEVWEIPVDDNVKIPILSGLIMNIVIIFV